MGFRTILMEMRTTLPIPWLCDHHSHVSLYAALQGCPDLSSCAPAQAMALLRGLPADRITTVRGWHSSRLPLGAAELEALPPAIILNFSLHGFRLTPAARGLVAPEHLDLLERQDDPVWCERNMARLLGFFGASAGFDAAGLDAFMTGLERVGIGAVEDLLLLDAEALRVIRASAWAGRIRVWAAPDVFRTLAAGEREAVAGLKLFTDGALGARTAAMDRPFRGGGDGLLLYGPGALARELAELAPLGKPVAIHAIGGRAITQTLDALAQVAAEGLTLAGARLEHVQFITLAQARRAKALGVTLSMQPNFSSDSEDYADRLEPEVLAANNPFRMLVDQAGFRCGEDLVFGSDGMPHGVACALQWSLFPRFPGQRLTVAELLAGYGVAAEGQGVVTLRVDAQTREVRLLGSEAR